MIKQLKSRKKILMYTLATTIITGVLSMAFSKNMVKPKNNVVAPDSFYDLNITDINGENIHLSKFKGKKVMIVNVASRCGYTSQYRGLQELYNNHQEELEIIAIPCNDFGSQESGSNSDIRNFCETRYGVSFTMGSKQNIKSSPISPIYKWLSDPKQNGWNSNLPSWNFCKYIINEEGQLTHFLRSSFRPNGEDMKSIIKG
tara:strand:+ start:1004 stop:1606 length:603 start_codon:yes stop_codon:yes gene_type:complete